MKPKTNKSITKRFKVTKNKKMLFRFSHQNHFNAKYSGNITRRKRKSKEMGGALKKTLIQKTTYR